MDKKDIVYLVIIFILSSLLVFQYSRLPQQDLPQQDFTETLPKMGQE